MLDIKKFMDDLKKAENCDNYVFRNLLKEYGTLCYQRGEFVIKHPGTRSKKYAKMCDECELKFNEFCDKYAPICKCEE